MQLLTLLLASLAMLGLEACSNHACTLVGCADGVTVRRNLTVTSPAVADLTLTVCLNGECGSGKLEASEGGGPLCKLSGRFVNNFCSLSRSPGAAEFLLSVEVSNRAPMDGDVYRFKLVRGDTGAVAFDLTTNVTYKTIEPNGADCEPTCRIAQL